MRSSQSSLLRGIPNPLCGIGTFRFLGHPSPGLQLALIFLLAWFSHAAFATLASSRLMPSDLAAYDNFGAGVAMGPDTVLVGAPFDDDSGAVYVFGIDSAGNWIQQAKLLPSDGTIDDRFGHSVSLSGDLALIGAPGDDDNGSDSGSAYIFTRDAAGNWSEQAKLTAYDGKAYDAFGGSVSAMDDTVVVGASGGYAYENDAVYVFTRDASGNWTQVTKLVANDTLSAIRFGCSVSLGPDRLLVGALHGEGNETHTGAAYLFERDAAGVWTQTGKLTALDGAMDDGFGYSVSLQGDTALVGAIYDDDVGINSGTVYLFSPDASGVWRQKGKLQALKAGGYENFGIALSSYGDVAVVGALNDLAGPYLWRSGFATIFVKDASGNWNLRGELPVYGQAQGDRFGSAAAIHGGRVIVGAPGRDMPGLDNSGAAYLYDLDLTDADGDGLLDFYDNCPGISNANQTDTDGDGIGDVCDPDDDNDGVPDVDDAFPLDWSETTDTDGDGIGNNADPDDDNDGIPDWIEQTSGLDPLDAGDAAGDLDGDGFSNLIEYRMGTDPQDPESSPDTQTALHYKLLSNDGQDMDRFGSAVSISGTTAVVGASMDDIGNDRDVGSAYIYVKDAAGRWNQQAKLTAPDGSAYDGFGESVALDGDTVFIGASQHGDTGSHSGAVYIFERNPAGDWVFIDKLLGVAGSKFGVSVAVEGDSVLIGAPNQADASGIRSGSAHVYVRDVATGSWILQGTLFPSSGTFWDEFGSSVSISGNTALIGAPGSDNNGIKTGAAYVFVRGAGGTWSQQARLSALDGADADRFGGSVSLSGDTAVIGAAQDDDAGSESGSAYVFVRDATGNWTQQTKLTAFDAAASDYYGSSISLSGDLLSIGAPGTYFRGVGTTYVYLRDSAGNWSKHGKLENPAGVSGDEFGRSVSLAVDKLLVGAPEDADNLNAGAAYVYEIAGRDSDGDNILDFADNCLSTANPDQADLDDDGLGDACDDDMDGDGVPNAADLFPEDPAESIDSDGDGIGDNADPDDDNDRIPDTVEFRYELNPWLDTDANGDLDQDGFSNLAEFRAGTSLFDPDDNPATVRASYYKLLASDGQKDDGYGASVAISGDTMFVGASGGTGLEIDSGVVYVYVRDAAGEWVYQSRLSPPAGVQASGFGHHLSFSGDTVLVSAYLTDVNGLKTGVVYVYVRDGAGGWTREAELLQSGDGNAGDFGSDIAIQGDTALIGSPRADGAASGSGAAYVFLRDNTGTWSQQARLMASDGAGSDGFGRSVSLSANTALIGADNARISGSQVGAAYVFTNDGAGNWTQQAKLAVLDNPDIYNFGISVSLDGDAALIGVSNSRAISAYVFTRDTAGNWSRQSELVAYEKNQWMYLGIRVFLSGDLALIGFPGEFGIPYRSAVYVFMKNAAGNWDRQGKLFPNDRKKYDGFGGSVAQDGGRILVGALWDDDNGQSAGAVYVYAPLDLTDSDGDSIMAFSDNCPSVVNGDQLDTDLDGIGDLCDGDDDGDGVPDGSDAYPLDASRSGDSDGDGIDDNIDNCPAVANPGQANTDNDRLGDACDSDDDGDGIRDQDDAYPLDNTRGGDFDGDGLDSVVDADDDNDGLSDLFETGYGLDPFDARDGVADPDADGYSNRLEYEAGTSPLDHRKNPDTVSATMQRIFPAAGLPGSLFGDDVAIDGDTAVFGYGDADASRGAAFIYERDAAGAWVRQARLEALDGKPGDQFGNSVSLSGDAVLIGAPRSDGNDVNTGAAYLFVRDAAGNWVQQAKIYAGDGERDDYFGIDVSLSGDTALIGAYQDKIQAGIPVSSGSAYVFVRDLSGQWTMQDKLLASDRGIVDSFGYSVSLSGNTALIGAFGDGWPNKPLIGSAYVFTRGAAGSWTQQARLAASDGRSGDYFGYSVSLSGDTALVGAWLDDGVGSAYLYERDRNGNWSQSTRLTPADGGYGDGFGASVSLGEGSAVIGAGSHGDEAVNSGAVYLYTRNGSGEWSQALALRASDGGTRDYLGYGVALSGNTIMALTSGHDNGGTSSVSVFEYILTDHDGDGVRGIDDNCPSMGNPGQMDGDGDGWGDACDAFPGDAAEWVDSDGDGTGNNADTDDDNDGVPDGGDRFPYDPAASVDDDGDGYPDRWNGGATTAQILASSLRLDNFPANPGYALDEDGDGLADEWELQYFNDLSIADAGTDSDNDGLADGREFALGTSPVLSDSDGDGDSDGDEVRYKSDPLSAVDTLDSHRPYAPVMTPLPAGLSPGRNVFDVTGFDDPDLAQGDALDASEWTIGADRSFSQGSLVFRGIVERRRRLEIPAGLLRPAQRYWIRVRHRDSTGLWSPWSQALSFDTSAVAPDDQDGDGIDDAYQVNGFTDVNGNGVDDAREGVRVIQDPEQGMAMGVRVSGQGKIGRLGALPLSAVPATLLPAEKMPYGMFSFRIDGLDVDLTNPSEVTLTFYFPEALPADLMWYKYDIAGEKMKDFSSQIAVDGSKVTLTLTDGGAGDADGIINGVIVDPSGAALPSSLKPAGFGSGGGGGGQISLQGIWVVLLYLLHAHLRSRRLG